MTSSAATAPRQADPEWTFGDRLRKARVRYGATQRDFADELEVKHATYAAWEADRTTCPRETAVAKRIEVLTGTRAVWVLGLDEPGPRGDGPSPGSGRDESSGGATTRKYLGTSGPAICPPSQVTPLPFGRPVRRRVAA